MIITHMFGRRYFQSGVSIHGYLYLTGCTYLECTCTGGRNEYPNVKTWYELSSTCTHFVREDFSCTSQPVRVDLPSQYEFLCCFVIRGICIEFHCLFFF